MLDEDILYLPIRELQAHLRKHSFSATELARSYLDRSRRIGSKLNAYVTITEELALEQARVADREILAGHHRGPLHGIPYALKDLVAVKGYRTTWGARPYADQKFEYNATIVEKLNQAGAVLIGKAAMIELAGGLGYSNGYASLTGPCKNPWNTDCWTCGSSSGSGSVVAAALAPWALGSDTRGSIICPASWCGITGMRPSFGRVSRYGAMAIAWSMDKLGPMARTADDCGLILSVIAGHDPKDHDSLPSAEAQFRYPAPELEPRMPLRVGRLTNVWNKIDPEVQKAADEGVRVLERAGTRVSDAQVPDGPFEQAAELTILIEAASAFQKLIDSGECAKLTDPLGQINGYASRAFSASDYLLIQRVRTILQREIDNLFDSFDVLTTAGQPDVAQPLVQQPSKLPQSQSEQPEAIETRAPDGVSSLCGLPAIAVPCGFCSKGLPIAIQFVGRAGNDHGVMAAARLFQRQTDWHKKRPDMSRIAGQNTQVL
ncbi:MAG: amidase [Acidobacteriaceae bacterium]|nr:amidase [Acidobacteriaceae bacterium]MBV9296159.1 amidase [Acidobacteriaceae bacterium]MBV9766478.1 amidase [Acidobacteriaceae bacterium]